MISITSCVDYDDERSVLLFKVKDKSGQDIPYTEWLKERPDIIVYISILKELIENGNASLSDNYTVTLDLSTLYELSSTDLIGLGLPLKLPYELIISAKGILNQPEFCFETEFYDFYPHGNKKRFHKNGAFVEIEGSHYLLSGNLNQLFEIIKKCNQEKNRTLEYNLGVLAKIKILSKCEPVRFDTYLQNENVIMPSAVRLEIEGNENLLELKPSLDEPFDPVFQKNFDLFPKPKSVYPINNNGEKVRVLFGEQQFEQLQKVKQNRKIKEPQQIQELIENPLSFFDPEVIDISQLYSSRVIEIGIYKPKFSAFVSPYKSEWLPGIELDLLSEGKKNILLYNQEELEELKNSIRTCEEKGDEQVIFKDDQISLDAAKSLATLGEKQFSQKEPLTTVGDMPVREKKVLIIRDNAETLDYEETVAENKSRIEHILHPVQNLNAAITLKDHQKEGVAWMQNLYNGKYPGALMADDMGLGKTLQILYFIEWLVQQDQTNKPVLVVAPVSLLENWEEEYIRFFQPQSLRILKLYGSMPFDKKGVDKEMINALSRKQLILTNYETLRTYQLSICAVEFSAVVLDEAQRIKTPGTLITSVAKALKADFKIAMSGTPVENSLMDLWCIADFAQPGLLGTAKNFSKKYQLPLKKNDIDVAALGEELRAELGIFIKRRLKMDVAKDLPDKYLSNKPEHSCHFDSLQLVREMPEIQMSRYLQAIREAKDLSHNGSEMLLFILKIKEISDHPFLVDGSLEEYDVDELIASSAKLQSLIEILDLVKQKGEKAIVFTERKDTQRMIQRILLNYYGIEASIINGDTPSSASKWARMRKSRQETIAEFRDKEGFGCMILSPIAAGVGLNITVANHVIHYSRHWNPAKEEQATDRAFRIGQKRDVFVYYPMAVSPLFESFDLILDKLLTRKLSLASHTLFPTEQTEVHTADLFENLLKQ